MVLFLSVSELVSMGKVGQHYCSFACGNLKDEMDELWEPNHMLHILYRTFQLCSQPIQTLNRCRTAFTNMYSQHQRYLHDWNTLGTSSNSWCRANNLRLIVNKTKTRSARLSICTILTYNIFSIFLKRKDIFRKKKEKI